MLVGTSNDCMSGSLTTDPDMEEEHKPRLRIEEGFNHLISLECFVLHPRLVLPDLVNYNGLLSLADEHRPIKSSLRL
jgi:hypothetical protein